MTLKDIQGSGTVPSEMEHAAALTNPEIVPPKTVAAPASESDVQNLASKSIDQMNVAELRAEMKRLQGLILAKPKLSPASPEAVESKAATDQAQLEQQRSLEQQQNAKQLAVTNPRTLPATGESLSNMADRDVALHEMQTERQQKQAVDEAFKQPSVPSLEQQAEKGHQFENKLTADNENFAEKSAQPLPPKPSGLLHDLSQRASAVKTIGSTLKDAVAQLFPVEASGFKRLLAGGSESAENAATTLRGGMNRAMNEHQGAMESLSHAEDAFDKLPVELQRDFQARMYDNLPQATPELRTVSDQMYAVTEQRRQQIADLGVDAAKDWERQHWNMMWKSDPEQAAILRDRIYGSGKLGGKAAGTLNPRTEGDFQSKLDAGLVPVEDNPLKQFAATDEAQRRFIGMGRAVKGLAEDGTIVRTDTLPPGMVDITGVLPKSLQNMVKGEEGHGIIAAPKNVADLIRNVVTPSWFEGGPVRRGIRNGLRATNNFLTQIALGLSGFHLKKVFGLEQPAMSLAERLGPSEFGQGLPIAGRAAKGEQVQNAMMGLSEMLDPVHRQIIDAMQNQMTAQHERFYDNSLTTNFRDAVANHSPWEGLKSAVKASFVVNQKLTQDLIFKSVQRAKLSFAFDSLQRFIADHPDVSTTDIQTQAAKIADHVDNIMGLMNRDNLLWNRTARDIASLSMLSVGWNYGTLRSLAGAGSELAGVAKGDTSAGFRATKYWLASLAMAGMYGTMKSYLTTGHAPQSTVDAMFPKTGKKDQQGRDVRENPGFYSNDIYDLITNPAGTIAGKLSPILHILGDLGTNKDYAGRQIINHDDSYGQQAEQLGSYLAAQHLEPISIRNIIAKWGRATDDIGRARAIVGGLFSRQAPISISESPAERLAHNLEQSNHMPISANDPSAALMQQWRQQLYGSWNGMDDLRTDPKYEALRTSVRDAIDHNIVTGGDVKRMLADTRERINNPGLGSIGISGLGPTDLLKVWNAATPDERQSMADSLSERLSRLSKTRTPDLPDWKVLHDAMQGDLQPAGH
jgi:hypothetical protein